MVAVDAGLGREVPIPAATVWQLRLVLSLRLHILDGLFHVIRNFFDARQAGPYAFPAVRVPPRADGLACGVVLVLLAPLTPQLHRANVAGAARSRYPEAVGLKPVPVIVTGVLPAFEIEEGGPRADCKPDSVPWGGGHLSGTSVARRLVRPIPEGSGRAAPFRPWAERPPIWSCSGRGLPGRPVTRPPVGSYPTISPLPAQRPAVSFLWHFPSGHPDWALPSALLCGVRTFLHAGVATGAATTRPPRPDATLPPTPASCGRRSPGSPARRRRRSSPAARR